MRPVLVVGEDSLNPVIPRGQDIPQNQMFDLRVVLNQFISENPDVKIFDASQGDGGSSLPGVPRYILKQAQEMLLKNGTGYSQPHGSPIFRKTVIENYWKLDSDLGYDPMNVVSCCGGRDALLKAYDATQDLGSRQRGGFVVTTRVPWISYNWGPYCVGANIMLAPGEEKDSWALTPEAIQECVNYANSLGREVSCLVITSPDNPTGRYTSLEDQITLTRSALQSGVRYVLLDWMYHWVSDRGPFSLNQLLHSFSPAERDRIIVLDGLTKSLGGSNIRNAHLIASKPVVKYIKDRASHGVIPCFYGEAVAVAAYQMGYDIPSNAISGPTSKSRQVLREYTDKYGIETILDQGYYGFLNVAPWIEKKGMKDSAELGIWMAREHGLAIVPGYYFSQYAANWIRFSYALRPEDTERTIIKLYELLNL